MLKDLQRDKTQSVGNMFGRIARRYDMGNRVLSLGRDRSWRRQAVAMLAPRPCDLILDIGAGTGDLSIEIARRGSQVVAADLSRAMVSIGAAKVRQAHLGRSVRFITCDAMSLPFSDNSFDAVAASFTIRNFASMALGFEEIKRVLKPDGRIMTLEFVRPTGLMSPLYRMYLSVLLPFIGGSITGDRRAYSYLANSIKGFLSADVLARHMEQGGLERVEFRRFDFGTVAVHLGYKCVGESGL